MPTLAQAAVFNLTEMPFIAIVSFLMLLVMIYVTIKSEKVRNFYVSNAGIALLVSVAAFSILGTAVMVPEAVTEILSIIFSIFIYPIITVQIVTILIKGIVSVVRPIFE